MTFLRLTWLCTGLSIALAAQSSSPRKKLLVIGEEKGYRHEAVPHAMATIERLGRETGLWDTMIRTDTEALTKKKLEYNAKNLNDFDAVLFYTGGTLEMDDQQKADFRAQDHGCTPLDGFATSDVRSLADYRVLRVWFSNLRNRRMNGVNR